STEQEPSPDGTNAGLMTFYDYQGKQPGYNFAAGTNALPSVRAWRLPNGETHYDFLQFDNLGNITNTISTYTLANGNLGTRTNQYIYTSNTYTNAYYSSAGFSVPANTYTVNNLLTQIIGPDGNNLWSYGGFATVTWTNIFIDGSGDTNIVYLTS